MYNIKSTRLAIRTTFAGLALFANPLAHADSLHITGRILPNSCIGEQSTSLASFHLSSCPEQAHGARVEVHPASTETVLQIRLLETRTDRTTHAFSRTYQIVEKSIDTSVERLYLVSVIYP